METREKESRAEAQMLGRCGCGCEGGYTDYKRFCHNSTQPRSTLQRAPAGAVFWAKGAVNSAKIENQGHNTIELMCALLKSPGRKRIRSIRCMEVCVHSLGNGRGGRASGAVPSAADASESSRATAAKKGEVIQAPRRCVRGMGFHPASRFRHNGHCWGLTTGSQPCSQNMEGPLFASSLGTCHASMHGNPYAPANAILVTPLRPIAMLSIIARCSALMTLPVGDLPVTGLAMCGRVASRRGGVEMRWNGLWEYVPQVSARFSCSAVAFSSLCR